MAELEISAPQSAGTRAATLTRLQYPLATAFLLLFFVIGWHGREPPMRAAGDDEFVYLALSKSLESGSYREIYRQSAPSHVQYPPGYPAWLIVARHAFGENFHLIRAANLLLAAAGMLLLFLVARRLAGVGPALTLLFLLALNRGMLTAGSLTSEGLFLFVSAAALAWMHSPAAPERRTVAVAIALGLFAFLTRSIGLAVVLAVGAWLWSSRRRGALLAWALASVVVVGGWFAYGALQRSDPSVQSYASDFVTGIPTSGGALQHLAARVWHKGVAYATTHMPDYLSIPTISGTRFDNWLWLALNAVLITIGFGIFWRRWRAAAVYVVCYIGAVLLWPFESGRLLIPMIPLGMLALLLGARWLTAFLPDPARGVVLGSLVALLGFGALQGGVQRYRLYRNCDRAHPYSSKGCYDPPRLALIAAAQYIRSHAEPADVVFTDQTASVNFLTGHLTEPLQLIWSGPGRATDLMRARRARFILLNRPWQANGLLSSCAELEIRATFQPDVMVLSLAGPQSSSNACPVFREMVRLYPQD